MLLCVFIMLVSEYFPNKMCHFPSSVILIGLLCSQIEQYFTCMCCRAKTKLTEADVVPLLFLFINLFKLSTGTRTICLVLPNCEFFHCSCSRKWKCARM